MITLTIVAAFFIIPVVEIILGLMKPKKEINNIIGYRTAKTMSSQEMWDYGQLLMKKYMLRSGIISLIIGIIGLLISLFLNPLWAGMLVAIIVVIQSVVLVVAVVMLENAMNKK